MQLRCSGRAAVVVGALALCPPPYSAAADAHSKPLFEVGLAGGGYLPHDPASDESYFRALAPPFVAYRSEFLRSDEKGLLRGRILSTERLELDVTLTGSLPADADDNEARRGTSKDALVPSNRVVWQCSAVANGVRRPLPWLSFDLVRHGAATKKPAGRHAGQLTPAALSWPPFSNSPGPAPWRLRQ